MWGPRILVGVAVSATVLLAALGLSGALPQLAYGMGPAGFYPRVLYPAGEVFRFPGERVNETIFTLPSGGGWIVGRARADHFLDLEIWQFPVVVACPLIPMNETYTGAAWNYNVDEYLHGGTWYFGPICYAYGNVTVTQSFVVT